MSIVTQPPVIPRAIRTTVLMILLHSFLWAAALFGLFVWVPRAEQVFRDFNVKLPTLTKTVTDLSRRVESHIFFVGTFLFFLLVMDGMIYFRLRSSAPGFVNRLWAASMFTLPVAVIIATIIGLMTPLTTLQGLR